MRIDSAPASYIIIIIIIIIIWETAGWSFSGPQKANKKLVAFIFIVNLVKLLFFVSFAAGYFHSGEIKIFKSV